MTQISKLIERLLSRPSDFRFSELSVLLGHLGYGLAKTGKTGGSRVVFVNQQGDYLRLHRPHPGSILKRYQVDDVIAALKERGLL